MTTLNIGAYGNFGTFVVREANGYRSREQVALADVSVPPGTNVWLPDGAVLGRKSSAAKSAAAQDARPWNSAGNATFSAITVDANAALGNYIIRCTSATAFVVVKDDVEVGTGTFGAAYDGPINFTITAGGTPQVAGDEWLVVVTAAAGSGEYVAYDPTANDGSQVASAILLGKYDAAAGPQDVAVIVRDCEVQWAMLAFAAGMSEPDKSTARSQLAANGIVFR